MGVENTQIDIVGILNILPHRYPFVLIDRLTEVVLGEYAVGLKNVTINEPFFQGHFPVEPVMPGVLILESMAQVGGILAYLTEKDNISDELLYYAGIDGARFRRKVVPAAFLPVKQSPQDAETKYCH